MNSRLRGGECIDVIQYFLSHLRGGINYILHTSKLLYVDIR